MSRPMSTDDLRPSERLLLRAMHQLGFGRFESLRIERGELLLDPWPTAVRGVRFGSEDTPSHRIVPDKFELKRQVAELFQYVRTVEAGEIRCLEVRHGLPFSMQVVGLPPSMRQ